MLFFHSLGFHSRILRIWVCMDHVDVLYVYIYFYLVHSPGINAWKEAQYICYLFSPVCFLLNILHHFNICSFFLHIRHFELVSSLLVRGNRIGTWILELFIFSQFEESVYQPCNPSLWNDSSHSRHYFVFLFLTILFIVFSFISTFSLLHSRGRPPLLSARLRHCRPLTMQSFLAYITT